jgi:pimeloyl-ACP methyl ester carboxylesterase
VSTYLLIPGAGTGAWCWDLVADELRGHGHEVVAVDLPLEDDTAGLEEYSGAAIAALGGDEPDRLVVVGHSLGGFTAALVCGRVNADSLVLVQAMIPAPGETPEDWFANTGYAEAEREEPKYDDVYYNGVPEHLAKLSEEREREQSSTPMSQPWPLEAWPEAPTRFLLCTEDRFFPANFMRRVVRERLGIEPDEIAAGHMPMLSHPQDLAGRLLGLAEA